MINIYMYNKYMYMYIYIYAFCSQSALFYGASIAAAAQRALREDIRRQPGLNVRLEC